jgi:2-deoxy-D-gluconate 3-dehydrogenase
VGAFDLSGKQALVTGASKGIGRAIALAYAEAGADVALVSRSAESLAEVGKEIEALGRRAVVIPADLTDRDAATGAVAAAVDALGHLDILVNNAGGSNFMVEFKDLRLSGWDKLMRLNLDSAMVVCHAAAPHLLERGGASVINVASVAALGAPFLAPYAAAKAGLVALTKTLAVEWAQAGVRVNALCPGWTATELNRNLWEDEAASAATVGSVPMRRWGTVEEMAQPAVFLASAASAYMTGQVLFIDGGATAI